jgi:hypothetical protein
MVDVLNDEGRVELPSEEQVYAFLGLQKEVDSEKKNMEGHETGCGLRNDCDDHLSTIPIFQDLSGERRLFDKNTPMMEPGCVYPSMKEFRLAMRQYAIEKEFELDIEATDKMRYRGYYRGGDCSWSINARVEQKGSDPLIVTMLNDVHACISSGRRRTTTPSSNWVAYRALSILMSKSDLGVKNCKKGCKRTIMSQLGTTQFGMAKRKR